jgi:hypothetical protein
VETLPPEQRAAFAYGSNTDLLSPKSKLASPQEIYPHGQNKKNAIAKITQKTSPSICLRRKLSRSVAHSRAANHAQCSSHIYHSTARHPLDMGCNLFINKPPALTSEQIRQLDILAQKNNALTGVVFYRRFSPLVRKGKTSCETKGPVHSAGISSI